MNNDRSVNSEIKISKFDAKFYLILKRMFDVFMGILLLPILIFATIFIGILIKIDSKGPVFFIQERSGLNNNSFKIFKYRTMCTDRNLHSQFTGWTEENDPRITRVGKVLRRFRIDELPQALNLLIGNMSLVGPRPETVALTEKFSKEIPNFSKRMQVKPGITGFAQVNGGYDLSPSEKLKYDLEYIVNFGLRMDIFILFKTVSVILFGKGSR